MSTYVIRDGLVCDNQGRSVLLRGCSVSGNAKQPSKPDILSHQSEGLYAHRNVSFVGRPFPLAEAPVHFARLRDWGMQCIRLVVPWEAIEHGGPGVYDEEYIDYVHQLLLLMPGFDLTCIIDAHQDVWSRLCGGSGAPGWTLELAGFDVSALSDTYAAHIHAENTDPSSPPPSAWPTGYQKLASTTMFTLFWAGDEFAPSLRIPLAHHAQATFAFARRSGANDVGIGTFLQDSMIAAYATLASRLQACSALLGFEPMNEPHRGLLEIPSFHAFSPTTDLAYCWTPSALQSMALASGYPQKVPYYDHAFPVTKIVRTEVLKPKRSAWRTECIWKQHGVWQWDESKQEAVVMRNSYFEYLPGTQIPVDFYTFWFSFTKRFGERMCAFRPTWFTLAGAIPNEYPPVWPEEQRPPNLVYAPHFYDLHTLFSKELGNMTVNVQGLSRGMPFWKGLYFGRQGIKDNYALQTRNLRHSCLPNYFSEIGTTFEANVAPAHRFPVDSLLRRRKRKDWRWQTRQIDALLSAMDALAVGYAFWNYNPDNDGDHLSVGPVGDGWNGEDFSWCFKTGSGGKVGTRCLEAILRPYPLCTAGRCLTFRWNMHTLDFEMCFISDASVISKETVVFLPRSLYSQGQLDWTLSDGKIEYDEASQLAKYTYSDDTVGYLHSVALKVVDNATQRDRIKSRPPSIDLELQGYRIVLLLATVCFFGMCSLVYLENKQEL